MNLFSINHINQTFKIVGKVAFTGIMYGLVAKIWQMGSKDSKTEDNINQTFKIIGKAAFTGIMYGLVGKVWRLK